MTTQVEARNLLLGTFRSEFERLHSPQEIPWTHDNLTFDGSGRTIWIDVMIRQTASTQRTLGRPGNRRYRREGVLTATIRTLPGIGLEKITEIAQEIRGIFEGTKIQGINPIGGVLVQEQGRDITGYSVIVSFPFWYEERG